MTVSYKKVSSSRWKKYEKPSNIKGFTNYHKLKIYFPKDCYKYDVSIAGTPSTTTEVLSYETPEQCQTLCQRTKDCAWFELDKMRTCHLKNEATNFIANPWTNGIISGPQICGGKS